MTAAQLALLAMGALIVLSAAVAIVARLVAFWRN